MRVLVCEDDPLVRSVISDLVEHHGGHVLAETDAALDAVAFVERFEPDVVVLDLALRHGSGVDVISALRQSETKPHVIVFTAHDSNVRPDDEFVDSIRKPDFDQLAQMIASAHTRVGNRRRPVREVPLPRALRVDDPHDFFQLVAGACPGDTLLSVQTRGDGLRVAEAIRRTVRAQDRVLCRSDDVIALLIGGGVESVRALERRLQDSIPDIASRAASVVVDADPVGAYTSLTSA